MYLYEDRHEEYTDLLLLCKSYLTNIKAPSDLKSPLLIAGLNDTDWEVRKRATKLLGLLGDPVYRDRLIAVLNSKQEKAIVRAKAAEALGKFRVSEVIEALN